MVIKRKRSRFNLPWSNQGWYPERVRRREDPEIMSIIAAAGSRRINPLGFRDDRATVAITPATHNPYLNFLSGFLFIAVGVFLWGKLDSVPLGALAVGGFFWGGGLLILFMNVIRIPAWHRARRAVREYLSDHEGTFPKQLRWYS